MIRYRADILRKLLRGTGFSFFLCSICLADPIVVKSVRGSAEIQKANSQADRWRALQKGMPVKPGDTVRTGKNARVELKINDGSRVLLGSKSKIQVALAAPSRIFNLMSGRVKSFVKKLQPQSKFEIKTPLAAAAVRGTVFEMGFDEEKAEGFLVVDRGVVALTQADRNVDVHAGERMGFMRDVPLGDRPTRTAAAPVESGADTERQSLRREVGLGMSKETVMAAAADEIRRAEYQEGKTMTDINGNRVRLEEYIIRRPADAFAAGKEDQSFKFVVLNERSDRFDYFYYLGIFNKTLPSDLSVALRDVRGKLNAEPDYFLDAYEMGQSNTQDAVLDRASGGHLVKVTFDGSVYTLTDPNNPTDQRTVAADQVIESDDAVFHKVYDPIADRFTTITDEQFTAGGGVGAVYDGEQESFRALESGDIYWRPGFNAYSHTLQGPGYTHVKQSYQPRDGVSTILSLEEDAAYTYPANSETGDTTSFAISETPSGADTLHNRITIFFADGTVETVDSYILSDEGKVAPSDAFAGLTTGVAFKNELLKWNYEHVIEATEFQGRKIDLVVEPKILIKSGLIP
jgi:hypothetical protein